MKRAIIIVICTFVNLVFSQDRQAAIPASHANIERSSDGHLFVRWGDRILLQNQAENPFTLTQMQGQPKGTDNGIEFDFQRADFSGTLTYGFIAYGDSKHPMPVYFHTPAKIEHGKAAIDIKKRLSGIYDMIGWQKSGRGTLGYRVANADGELLYDGRVTFKGRGPFEVDVTVLEGPFVNLLKPDGATISFETNIDVLATIRAGGKTFRDELAARHHEIVLSGLRPDTEYAYVLDVGSYQQTFSLRTQPRPGSRSKFVFSYCSDSRSGQGGGERNLHGTNFYIMKKIMALNAARKVRFCQFTGDLVTGYLTDAAEMHLQYANWKRAVEPFAHYFPINASIGNHEVFVTRFQDARGRVRVTHFPYSESSEVLFAENFVNPRNGPDSEDGAIYDPNPDQADFPDYEETVFYYTYDNVAIVSLNSDYWFAPSKDAIPTVGGNPHGYVMDNQLAWLDATIEKLEKDEHIDHVFVTIHTPFFPNGGHVKDDMWYRGNNAVRPYVAGKPVEKGIIERRDQLLDILVNKSRKVVALLTGDEHNYNKLKLSESTPRYPDDWSKTRLKLRRTIYQINDGAAGAPYYSQEQTPWSADVTGFTTQNALVFFHVNDKKIDVEVLNPDTLEEVDTFKLR